MKRHKFLNILIIWSLFVTFLISNVESENQSIVVPNDGPALLVKPDSSIVPANTKISFFCRADGNPIPSVIWKKNGQPIHDSRFTTKALTNGLSTLRIEPVLLEDSNSTISCTADNGVGRPIKSEALLTVLPESNLSKGFPIIEAHPVLKSVEQGRTAYITCKVKGDPRPRVLWLRDMMPIDIRSNNRYSVSTLGNPGALMIQQAREEDQGKYECVARNEHGVIHSQSAHIYVKVRRVPPYFTGKLQKVYKVGIGTNFNITCMAVGYPMPRVFWKRKVDDTFLTDPETAPIGKNVLSLTNIEKSENYTCIAVSKLGNIETTIMIDAKELLSSPIGFTVIKSEDCSVKVKWNPVKSMNNDDPVINYVIKYRQKIPTLSSSTLKPTSEYAERGGSFREVKIPPTSTTTTIDGLEPYQQYELILYAVSKLGKGHPTLPLEVQTSETVPSNPPLNVRARSLNSQSVLVQWSPPDQPNGRITGYRIFYTNKETTDATNKNNWLNKEVKGDELLLTLSSLIPDQTYYIQVQSKNSKGYGPFSKTVTVITKQGVPGQPGKLIAKPLDSRRIMLTWEKPLFSYNIIGYTIRFNVSSIETKELRLTSDVQKHTVDGLKPDTIYGFKVAAHSNRGQGAFCDEVLAKTLQADALIFPSLSVINQNSSKMIHLKISGDNSQNVSSFFVVEYRIPPKTHDSSSYESYEDDFIDDEIEGSGNDKIENESTWNKVEIIDKMDIKIEDLIPNTVYELRLKGYNNETADSIYHKTAEDVPSAPKDLEIIQINASTIKLTWERPEHENGELVGYYVFKEKLLNGEPVDNHVHHELVIADPNKLYAYITGLEPNTEYAFRVCAFNLHGDGERTPPKKMMTGGVPPSPPKPQSVTMLSDDSPLRARIDWMSPEITYNQPVTGYRIFYKPVDRLDEGYEKIEVSGRQNYAELTKLYMGREYEIKLSAGNSDGWSNNATERLITPVGAPDGEPLNVRYDISNGQLTMQWDPPALDRRNGNITHYQAILTPLDGKTRRIERNVTGRSSTYKVNLKHGYTFKVSAVTMKGSGPYSPVLNISPFDTALVGPPSNVRVQATSNSSAVIQWDFDETSGGADGFIIKYIHEPIIGKNGREDTTHWRSQTVMDPKARHLEIIRLNAHKPYAFCVLAVKQSRLGQCSDPPITVDKLQPIYMVDNLHVQYKTSQSVSLKWDYNGPQPIRFYVKQSGQKTYLNQFLEEKNLVAPGYENKVDGNERSFMWQNLRQYMDYTFQVGIISLHDGTIYWPKEVKVRTDPTGPPFVDTPEYIESKTLGTAQLRLKPSTEEHGTISHYWLIVIPGNYTKDDLLNVDNILLERLTLNLKLGITSAPIAKKVKKDLEIKRKIINSDEDDDDEDDNDDDDYINNNDNDITKDKIKRALEDELIEAHEYIETETDIIKSITNSNSNINNDDDDDDRFIERINIKNSRDKRYINQRKELNGVYIAAKIEANEMRQLYRDEKSFTLGDGKIYNGYTNHPLNPNSKYNIMMRAFAKGDNKNKLFEYRPPMQEPISKLYTDSMLSDTFTTKGLRNILNNNSTSSIWIAGPLVILLILICIIGMIILFWFKSNKKGSRTNRHGSITKVALPTTGFINGQTSTESSKLLTTDTYNNRMNYEINSNNIMESSMIDMYSTSNGNINQPNIQTNYPINLHNNTSNNYIPKGPIPISELASHIDRLKINKNSGLNREFECIDSGEHFTWDISCQPYNSCKNRYANVVTYDHTRVKLEYTCEEGSDYINANYIDGYKKPKAYIATQGPMPETFCDFWRMIWEQRVKTIVMLTKLMEKNRLKCDQYWPTKGRNIYGRIAVTLIDTLELRHYTIRTFHIEHLDQNLVKEIKHMQYTAWPDHNVPDHPTPFLMFLKRVKTLNLPENGPIVCHCSAGIGRTGAFIAIDIMLDRLRYENTVDIFECVTTLRAQRFSMVQIEEQYSFIHDAVLDAAQSGSTEVPTSKLYQHMQRLMIPQGIEKITDLDLEYRTLCSLKILNSDCVIGNLSINRYKNRQQQIIPYDKSRVILTNTGIEGSDYINSSWVDGYRSSSIYIATQAPTDRTFEDFWRMLWEHESCIIVMLTKLREMGREKCFQYWPTDSNININDLNIEAIAEYTLDHYVLREFKIMDLRSGKTRTIRQFQFLEWPEQGIPQNANNFLEFIAQVHKTKSQFGVNGPITVHCSNGAGRTGVFIGLSTIIDRMNLENVVDVFTTIKLLRTERPNMVETKDEYQFCYQAAYQYLELINNGDDPQLI